MSYWLNLYIRPVEIPLCTAEFAPNRTSLSPQKSRARCPCHEHLGRRTARDLHDLGTSACSVDMIRAVMSKHYESNERFLASSTVWQLKPIPPTQIKLILHHLVALEHANYKHSCQIVSGYHAFSRIVCSPSFYFEATKRPLCIYRSLSKTSFQTQTIFKSHFFFLA